MVFEADAEPFDWSLESFAFCDAGDVDAVAFVEDVVDAEGLVDVVFDECFLIGCVAAEDEFENAGFVFEVDLVWLCVDLDAEAVDVVCVEIVDVFLCRCVVIAY